MCHSSTLIDPLLFEGQILAKLTIKIIAMQKIFILLVQNRMYIRCKTYLAVKVKVNVNNQSNAILKS